ncbi:hypothetical protein PAAG_00992 [Paracoccidioides lutzii Pb01]|uniref:Uncharacterized protein n=1 Tax=Paracoccidioides lutzii (strain ATCC MYA-826 / Pb01) TaxID=502779 RepID=C1GR47_PARBA|nr:hypothetical protein PAAG_00992 [Paracoccidioides lutzii Pb01]EEH38071.1 hypothetical protein PAAG_00992 [Paracoccidioides lutzii Pb01]
MTEPEDLEEDLFADLYDADDTTQSAAAPAAPAATPSFPEPQESQLQPQIEVNAQSVPPPQQQSTSNSQTYHHDTQTEQQHATNGEQQTGVNESTPITQDTEHRAANVEPGSHGTGIKEDG